MRRVKTWVTYRIAHVLVAMCGFPWTKGPDPKETKGGASHDDARTAFRKWGWKDSTHEPETAEACELEGFDSVMIEKDPDYIRLISRRMSKYELSEAA